MKIVKKIHFHDFRLKKLVNFWQTQPDFWTAIQVLLKMTALPLIQHNFRKNQEFRDFLVVSVPNGSLSPDSRAILSPPPQYVKKCLFLLSIIN